MKKRFQLFLAFILIFVALLPMLMMAWDKDAPAATLGLNASNPLILANWAALETAIGANHEFSTGGTNSGKHTGIVLQEQTSVTTAANEMSFYCKDLGTAPGIYVGPQSAGTAIQWSGIDAKILSAATDMLDEDAMGSNSATKTASQQSVKAFVTSGTVTMTNKTLTTPTITSGVLNTAVSGTAVLDEDAMGSNSATKVATQQSIKAYVATQVGSANWTPTSYADEESVTYPNGLIFKGGYVAKVGTTTTVTFGTAFPNAVLTASVNKVGNGSNYGSDIVSFSTSALVIGDYYEVAPGYYWQAWGR